MHADDRPCKGPCVSCTFKFKGTYMAVHSPMLACSITYMLGLGQEHHVSWGLLSMPVVVRSSAVGTCSLNTTRNSANQEKMMIGPAKQELIARCGTVATKCGTASNCCHIIWQACYGPDTVIVV